MVRILVGLATFIFSLNSYGSSCCGQNPNSFEVLSENQKYTTQIGYTYTQSQGRVYNDSNRFYIWENKNRELHALQFQGAGNISKSHQVFARASLFQAYYQDSFQSDDSRQVGDIQLGHSFQFFNEDLSSSWKPMAAISTLINIPTGRSIYDFNRLNEGTDVTGHNQWGLGLGLTLRKTFADLTFTAQGRTLYLFSKTFESAQVSDFFDTTLSLIGAYSTNMWDVTLVSGVLFSHLSERNIQPLNVTSDISQNFTLLTGLQRPLTGRWVAGITYRDQTLIGPAKNTLLDRGLTMNFIYNK